MKDKDLFITMVAVLLLILVVSPQSAYAHAALSPRTSAPAKIEVYQLVVFGEKSAPTLEVELIMPEGIEVQEVEPTAGWEHTIIRNSSGTISKIVWRGSLAHGGQVELRFVAKNAAGGGLYAFKAFQRYADGEVAEWDYAGMRVEVKARTETLTVPLIGFFAVGVVILAGFFVLMLMKRRLKRGRP